MPILPDQTCTGCTACLHSCRLGAITMKEDREGFLRPSIDSKRCVNCAKCEKVCPMLTKRDTQGSPENGVFAVKAKDASVHKRSQSGGAFYVLASEVVKRGGVVYGAALNDRFETEHIGVDSQDQLHRLQSVKYVQSRLGSTFYQVEKDLKNGTEVLFSGTPCQVSGLQSYLKGRGTDTSKLLTADLVCYGVPSPGVFRAWVQCLEKAFGSPLERMHYRRTDARWGHGKEYYRLKDGTELEDDYFIRWYFRNLIIRPSCESCQFCNGNRPGDITLGDFWGIDKVMPDFFDDRGVSLVMCSTQKGKQALEAVSDRLELRISRWEDAAASQPRLQNIAVKPNRYRELFWKKYWHKGIRYLAMEEGFIPLSFWFRVEKKLESMINKL